MKRTFLISENQAKRHVLAYKQCQLPKFYHKSTASSVFMQPAKYKQRNDSSHNVCKTLENLLKLIAQRYREHRGLATQNHP